MLDASRVAKHENIPFRFPRPDPIVQDMTTLDVAEHQPYIHRLTRLGAAAQLEGRSLAFTDAISRVLWDGTSRAGTRAIISPAQPRRPASISPRWMRRSADPDRYERVIAGNEQDHAASGHWGVPTFAFENEPSSARTVSISWSGAWRARA